MGAAEYNFDYFTDNGPVTPRVSKSPRVKKYREGVRWASSVAVAALTLAMVCSLIYGKAQVNELNSELQKTSASLKAAQDNYNYLSSQLDQRSGLQDLQQWASQRGMVKLNKNQITYLRLETQSRIELPKSGAEKLLDDMNTGMLSLFDLLAP